MYLNTEFGLALGLLSSLGLASVTPARQISIAKPPPNNVCNGTVSSILKSQAHLFSSGAIIHDTPDSPGFFNATERWTTYEAPTYIAAITPATEQDVVQTINLARKCNIPFLATGGRHGYTTTWSKLKNGLAIDLSQMRDLKVDRRAQTITVGPGIKIEDIFDPLWAAGLEMQSGSCPCPGLIGVTIGGGVGRYQGYYGLLIDDLVSARVITADGRILTASKTSNPDLFWAIRGAGANFGVVISATFKAHPVQDQGDNFVAEFVIFPNQTQRYFQTIEAMQPLPAPLASIMLNMYNPEANDAQIAAQWVYKGSEAPARRALKPIFDLGLISTATFSVKWPNLVKSAFGGEGFINIICAENVNRDLVSWNMKKYTAKAWQETFVKLQKFYQDVPGGRNSVINYELFPNQAMAAVPDSETAYPLRDSTGYVNLNLLFDQADQVSAQSAIAFGNDMRTAMTSGGNNGYDELRVFVNYAHGDEKLEQIYGKNKLPKLSQLKKKYDPTQMFSFNNGIPLRYP